MRSEGSCVTTQKRINSRISPPGGIFSWVFEKGRQVKENAGFFQVQVKGIVTALLGESSEDLMVG